MARIGNRLQRAGGVRGRGRKRVRCLRAPDHETLQGILNLLWMSKYQEEPPNLVQGVGAS